MAITKEEKEFAKKLFKQIKKDDEHRVQWKRKLTEADRVRQGLVKIKNWPWPGAAEFTMPFTDKIIRKMKAVFVLSLLGNKKWVVAEPPFGVEMTDAVRDACNKQEILINKTLRDPRQKFVKKVILLIDYMLEKGKFSCKIRNKVTVRPTNRTLFVESMITEILQSLVRAGSLDPNQPFDIQEKIKEFKKRKNDQLYPFLSAKFGFDPRLEDDRKKMNEIIGRFKRGEMEIDFDDVEVKKRADMEPVMPENIIYPHETTDIQEAPRRGHETFVTKQWLINMANKGFLDKKVVDELGDSPNKANDSFSREYELSRSQIEGINDTNTESERFRMVEIGSWWKNKRYMFLGLPDESGGGVLLKKPHELKENFNDLDEVFWPWVNHDFETKNKRYYGSRGVPEMLASVQESIDTSFNNTINRDIINNTPMFMLTGSSDFSERRIRFIPGQIIRVKSGDLKKFDTGSSVDISSDRISQVAKAFGEEYMGSPDFTFNNATNSGGSRTATEIDAVTSSSAALPQLDVLSLFDTFSQIAGMMFSITKQNFRRPVFVDDIKITRSDLELPCQMRWNGSLEQADKMLQAQKGMARLQAIGQLPETIRNDEDLYNAVFDWMDNDGVLNPDRYITKPEEQLNVITNQMKEQVGQLQQQQQALLLEAEELNKEIADNKKRLIAVKEDISEEEFRNAITENEKDE